MKRFLLSGVLFVFVYPVFAADLEPSTLMKQMPAIPAAPLPEDCDAAATLAASAEQQARADMMKVQQLSMGAMAAGGGAISDRQGKVIARLGDPATTLCGMEIAQSLANDPAAAFQAELALIRDETRVRVGQACPVIGMADYRDPECVGPILAEGRAREHRVVSQYVTDANAGFRRAADEYAHCAATREQLARDAEANALPAQYLYMAHGGRSAGWQQVATLAERYETLCGPAARALEALRRREGNL